MVLEARFDNGFGTCLTYALMMDRYHGRMILVVNTKNYLTPLEEESLISRLVSDLALASKPFELWVAPSQLSLRNIASRQNGTGVLAGAQIATIKTPRTGIPTPRSVKDSGATFLLINHRQHPKAVRLESPDLVLESLKIGLRPVLCVTGEEEAEKIFVKLGENANEELAKNLLVAIEPSDDLNDQDEISETVHRVRNVMRKLKISSPPLYGGGISSANVRRVGSLLREDSIRGILVSRAIVGGGAADFLRSL